MTSGPVTAYNRAQPCAIPPRPGCQAGDARDRSPLVGDPGCHSSHPAARCLPPAPFAEGARSQLRTARCCRRLRFWDRYGSCDGAALPTRPLGTARRRPDGPSTRAHRRLGGHHQGLAVAYPSHPHDIRLWPPAHPPPQPPGEPRAPPPSSRVPATILAPSRCWLQQPPGMGTGQGSSPRSEGSLATRWKPGDEGTCPGQPSHVPTLHPRVPQPDASPAPGVPLPPRGPKRQTASPG